MDYSLLVGLYERLDGTTKRLDKTYHLSEFLRKTPTDELPYVIPLLQGRIFPAWDDQKVGVASRLIVKAISLSTGITPKKIEDEWRKTGDLGRVAENLVAKKKQATLFNQDLVVRKVLDNIRKLATLEGPGSVDRKVQLIAELLTSATPLEARYITRTVLEELRVGVGEGSIRDAIVWAEFPKIVGIFFRCGSCGRWMPKTPRCLECGKELDPKFRSELKKSDEKMVKFHFVDELKGKDLKRDDILLSEGEDLAREAYNFLVESVQEAYDRTNDFAEVVRIARAKGLNGLRDVSLEPGNPVKVMLALKVKDSKEGIERIGTPLDAEYKLDGFRMQIHRKGQKVVLFTRRLEDVTDQFPEVVRYVKDHIKGDSFILDAEAVGFNPKDGKYMPFQHISQRIKRKYDIDKLGKELPVEVNVFDVLFYDGKSLLSTPFIERRKLLESIVRPEAHKLVLIKNLITEDHADIERFYQESVAMGNEGIMLKKLDAPYKPGARVGHMVKLKSAMETLDLVIVAAEWGEGKRANWLTSFTLACVDEDGEFLEIGKVGTGIKELEGEALTFEEITNLLKPLITSQKGRDVRVKPHIVVEIQFEEIQKSPTYSSGYALRFPRVIRLRTDEKGPLDASSLDYVEDLYHGQK